MNNSIRLFLDQMLRQHGKSEAVKKVHEGLSPSKKSIGRVVLKIDRDLRSHHKLKTD